jgi:putative ribosome biogenesis GTPase RsgA
LNCNQLADNWKNAAVKLALTGKSGIEKSSFINAIRYLKSGDPCFATASGYGNTTKKATVYKRACPFLLIFWLLQYHFPQYFRLK